MRPVLLVSLLLLSFLTQEAHGIRLRKGSLPARHPIVHEESLRVLNRNNNGVEEAVTCKGRHCSGRSRKLVTNKVPNSSTTAILKNDKNEDYSISEKFGGKEENNSPKSYPDILDIAGMDYSQATRKPPIHN
ncbi:Hypothetical predicted protein [Olea europaea subsp. europaea]|uniref:Uncharacterized protein n=1 Tax=Olea europaea subsp. europaea TaxID=158383 RepID=A0A8S0UL33_OLEEU|nr:Hypothetical predicted protein [Olea europaea subsp. europaea]